MHHSDWFELRYELIRDFPGCPFCVGDVLEAFDFEGKITLSKDKSIYPNRFKDHFRLLRWWEHRTIEQFKTIKYMKVVSGGNYWRTGDIVEVILFMFNNATMVGGKDNLLFNLSGHFFIASQVEPASKQDYEDFMAKTKH